MPLIRLGVHEKANNLSPDSRMRELLIFYNFLANELADAGVVLGEGTHVKHQLMGYHDFFVDNIAATDRVLDIGCGGGQLAADIARRTRASVTAIEIDVDNLAQARDNCAGTSVQLIHGDALRWQPPERLDVLVLSNILEHIEFRSKFLSRLFEQTGAERALIRVPLYERDWTVPMREQLGIEWRLDTTHFTEYRIPQFEQEMTDAGVEILNLEIRWSEIWAIVAPKPGADLSAQRSTNRTADDGR